jgi:hypothetical protein
MIRTRLTWIIVGAVVAVLVVAGVDALRSDKETSASTTTESTTTVEQAATTRPDCTNRQFAVSIEVGKPDPKRQRAPAIIFVRHVGDSPCQLDASSFRMTIKDRTGKGMGVWRGLLYYRADAFRDSEPLVIPCDRPGPFLALVALSPSPTPPGKPFRSEITC